MAEAARGLYPEAAPARLRVAVLSMHTSPLAPLGGGGNGGMNVYVREVCRAFGAQGVATDVFTGASSPGPIVSPGPLARVVPVGTGREQDDKYGLLHAVPAFAGGVLEMAAELRYDLIYSHYWLSGAAAALVKRERDVPWVHTAHTLGVVKNRSLATGAAPEPAVRMEVEKQVAKSADLLVSSTDAERDVLVRDCGADPRRVAVVYPGVDLDRFAPQAVAGHDPYLLFVGRLEPLKGMEIALRALAEVARHDPRLTLKVAGEDSRHGEKLRLRQVAARLGIAQRVEFLGALAHEELPRLYSGALASLVPSYSESFGLVALEAQACGCPVIASRLPGLETIVRDGVTGYLVDPGKPADMAARVSDLLRHPEGAAQMGRRAHLLAQRFTWDRTAGSVLSLAEDLFLRAQSRVQASASHE